MSKRLNELKSIQYKVLNWVPMIEIYEINEWIMTNAVNGYWKESQSVNKVPISEYSSNATIFHYVLAIRTESYKIREFMNSRHVA